MEKRIDAAAVLGRVDIVDVIDGYVPLKKNGTEFEACCPFHTEATPSFKVSPAKQFYHCFGCGANGDAIKFLREYKGMSFQDAVRELGGEVPDTHGPGRGSQAGTPPATSDGIEGNPAPRQRESPRKERKPSPWVAVLPAAAEAPEPPRAHIKRGLPERTWCYRDGAGRLLGYVYRFKTSDGGKEVLPLVWARNTATGAEEWHWLAFPAPRPLYGLDRLTAKPDATVLLVEGEKCADAAADKLPELVVVSWPGGGKAVGKVDWSPLGGRKVILWADCDAKRVPLTKSEKDALPDDLARKAAQEVTPLLPEADQPGVKTMAQIAGILHGLGCRLWQVEIPSPGEKPDGWDVADAIEEGLTSEALAAFIRAQAWVAAPADPGGGGDGPEGEDGASTPRPAGAAPPAWMRGMIWKGKGVLEDCRENVFLVLTQHPDWAGCLGWDEFARRAVKRRPTPTGGEPGEWTAEDDFELGLWLAQRVGFLVKGEGTLTNGVGMAAARRKFHPVREHFAALPPWDGTPRLEFWLEECLGAVAGNVNYLRVVGRLALLGLVARVMEPGCKWDYMPIFEGPQGRGKSTALRILGGEWFADTPLKLGDKDAYMQLDGVVLYEVGEMDAFNRAETTAVKAFVTTQVDHYREPYARRPVDRPRQVVFFGTTNQGEYLKDSTGNRRFWPIRCAGHIDLDKLQAWRPQLLAEALHLYRGGAVWRPTREEEAIYIRPEQEAREIVDPWIYRLQDFLDAPEVRTTQEFTSLDLLTRAVGMEVEKIDNNRGAATRIGNLMARLGWGKARRTTGKREWVYVRPSPAKEERTAQAGSGVGMGIEAEDEPVPF